MASAGGVGKAGKFLCEVHPQQVASRTAPRTPPRPARRKADFGTPRAGFGAPRKFSMSDGARKYNGSDSRFGTRNGSPRITPFTVASAYGQASSVRHLSGGAAKPPEASQRTRDDLIEELKALDLSYNERGYTQYVNENYYDAAISMQSAIECLDEVIRLINDDTSAAHIDATGSRSARQVVLDAANAELEKGNR